MREVELDREAWALGLLEEAEQEAHDLAEKVEELERQLDSVNSHLAEARAKAEHWKVRAEQAEGQAKALKPDKGKPSGYEPWSEVKFFQLDEDIKKAPQDLKIQLREQQKYQGKQAKIPLKTKARKT